MTSQINLELIIAAIGLFLSISTSVFIAGRRSQQIDNHEARIATLENSVIKIVNLEASMTAMSRDVAEIKGMFTLKLKE